MESESGLWGSLRRALEDDAGSQPGDAEPDACGPDLPYCGLNDVGCNGKSPSCACVDYLFECNPTDGTCSPITVGTAALLVIGTSLCCCCCYCRGRSGSPERHAGGCLESCCRICRKIWWLRCTRVLAVLCCVGLLGFGLWFISVVRERELLVDQYNGYVREWSNIHYNEFSRASFGLGLAVTNASGHYYPLDRDHYFPLDRENMIPPCYYPDLEQYTPLQYISDQGIIAENVVRSTNKIPPLPAGKAMEAHINVTLVAKTRVASSGGNITLHTQRMPVGSFQMYGEWPASQHLCEGVAHDSGQSRTADGACQVLRAVRSLCLVVSWKGSMEGWDWRSSGNGGKGCYGADRKRGWGDWVLANDLADIHGDASQLVDWQEGRFAFGAGVFEEHDPFLMIQKGGELETLMSSPEISMWVCFVTGGALALCTVGMVTCERRWRRDATAGAGAGADASGDGGLAGPLLSSSAGGGGDGGSSSSNQGMNATY